MLYKFIIYITLHLSFYCLRDLTCRVYRSGCIDVGDVICLVNGIDVTLLRHNDVMTLLEMTSRYPRYPVVLTLRRSAIPVTSTCMHFSETLNQC